MTKKIKAAAVLVFENTHLDIVRRNGKIWLIDSQIAAAMGYTTNVLMRGIYAPIAEKITDEMMAKVKMSSEIQAVSGIKKARIFSLPGAILLASSIHREIAKRFALWLGAILDSETPNATPQGASAPINGRSNNMNEQTKPASTSIDKFIEAQDVLCEATYVGEFLYGTVSNCAGGFELDEPETLGLLNVIRNLVEKIEKASALLDEHNDEQKEANKR